MKLMLRWGWGWGWLGHVNVRWHLRHEVDATLGMAVGHVNVRWHLRHEVHAMLGMGVGLGGAC